MGEEVNTLRKIVTMIRTKFEWKYLKINKEGMFVAGCMYLNSIKAPVVFNLDKVFYIKDEYGYYTTDDYKATFFRPKTSPCDVNFTDEIKGAYVLAVPICIDESGEFGDILWEDTEVANLLTESEKEDIKERLRCITKLSEFEIKDWIV